MKPRALLLALLLSGGWAWAQDPTGRADSRTDNFGNDVVYYLMIDRFRDGDPRNNVPHWAFLDRPDATPEEARHRALNRALLPLMYDPTGRMLGHYQGGDLQGVLDGLDYLADLGVTKLILSPVCDNANGILLGERPFYVYRGEDDTSTPPPISWYITGYHGYWTRDWFVIDEHFRSPDDEGGDPYRLFKEILLEAGKRGIGVMLDITLNQSSIPETPGVEAIQDDGTIVDADAQAFGQLSIFPDDGSIYKFGRLLHRYRPDEEVPDLFERPWLSWYHRPGFLIDFTNPTLHQLYDGRLAGDMPDLRQETWPMRHYLLDAVSFWAKLQAPGGPRLAGYRVDAIKHVRVNFWLDMEDTYRREVPGGALLGEFFGGGYRDPQSVDFMDRTQQFTIYDFELSLALRNFFAGERNWLGRAPYIRRLVQGHGGKSYLPETLRTVLNPAGLFVIPPQALEVITPAASRDMAVFLENHDLPRLRTAHPRMTDAAYESALRFLFTVRGVPYLNYGTEIGLGLPWNPAYVGTFGIGGDPFNRPMMIFPGEPGWNDRLHQTTRAMARLRRDYPVLRHGASRFLDPPNSDYSNDLFMVREDEEALAAAPSILYCFSTNGGTFPLSQRRLNQAPSLVNAETGEELRPDGKGRFHVRLRPEHSAVFIIRPKPSAPATEAD
ncbi:MAG: alpha-amylase family glycosyl hydrolase [Verrucomicrobiota bacterium]